MGFISGCGGNGTNEGEVAHLRGRVTVLNHRVATLESEMQRLKQNGSAGRRLSRLEARASILAKNDDAFYTSVGALYLQVYCDSHPTCHVPLSTPGVLYTDDRYPGRIFATPAP